MIENKYSKIILLETLYNLAERGLEERFKDFQKHALSVNTSMRVMVEYHTYKNALDKLSSAIISKGSNRSIGLLTEAKKSIDTYRGIEKYLTEDIELHDRLDGSNYTE